jgi:hypothetical protein
MMGFNIKALSLFNTVVLVQLAATLYMVGVIWVIQLVHYPLLAYVGEAGFTAYTTRHVQWISGVVGPAMMIEAITAVASLYLMPTTGQLKWAIIAGVVLLLVIWGATVLFSIPCHTQLQAGFNLPAIKQLVATNWVRTLGWTVRGGLLLWVVWQLLKK